MGAALLCVRFDRAVPLCNPVYYFARHKSIMIIFCVITCILPTRWHHAKFVVLDNNFPYYLITCSERLRNINVLLLSLSFVINAHKRHVLSFTIYTRWYTAAVHCSKSLLFSENIVWWTNFSNVMFCWIAFISSHKRLLIVTIFCVTWWHIT